MDSYIYHSYNNHTVLIFSAHFLSTQLTLSFPCPCISPYPCISLIPLPSLFPLALASTHFLLRLCHGKIPRNPDRPPQCLLKPSGLANTVSIRSSSVLREGLSFKSPKDSKSCSGCWCMHLPYCCSFPTANTNMKLNYHMHASSCSLYC